MHSLTVVTGMPGSGKTRLLYRIRDIDEYLDDDKPDNDLFERIRGGRRIAICNQMLWRHKTLIDSAVATQWYYFENDPASCICNIIRDGLSGNYYSDKRLWCVLGNMNKYDPYMYQDGIILPVYRESVTPGQIDRFFEMYPRCGDKIDIIYHMLNFNNAIEHKIPEGLVA